MPAIFIEVVRKFMQKDLFFKVIFSDTYSLSTLLLLYFLYFPIVPIEPLFFFIRHVIFGTSRLFSRYTSFTISVAHIGAST